MVFPIHSSWAWSTLPHFAQVKLKIAMVLRGEGWGNCFTFPLGGRKENHSLLPHFPAILHFPQGKNKKKPRRSMNFSGAGNSGARNRTRTCDLHRVKVAL